MEKRIEIGGLSSLKDVEDVMASHSLPKLPRNALATIGKVEGVKFKEALVSIANNEDAMNHSKVYVQKVASLLSPTVQAMLVSMNYVLPLETLLLLGKDCGREFRAMLSKAATGDNEAKEWIQKKVMEHGVQAASNQAPATKNVNPAPVQNNQSNVRPISQAKPAAKPDLSPAHSPYPDKSNMADLGEPSSDREFFSMTFYGNKSALCFNAVSKDGNFSINVDGGNKKQNQKEGGREIDWNDKVIFGFSADELIELAWVLLGLSPGCKFSGHGPGHDKSFEFKRQDNGYFGSVSAKDKGSRAVPMSYAAGLRLMFLVSRQFKKNYPDMTVNEILALLKTMANPTTQRPAQRQQQAAAG